MENCFEVREQRVSWELLIWIVAEEKCYLKQVARFPFISSPTLTCVVNDQQSLCDGAEPTAHIVSGPLQNHRDQSPTK